MGTENDWTDRLAARCNVHRALACLVRADWWDDRREKRRLSPAATDSMVESAGDTDRDSAGYYYSRAIDLHVSDDDAL